jgi:hypothetical protein
MYQHAVKWKRLRSNEILKQSFENVMPQSFGRTSIEVIVLNILS